MDKYVQSCVFVRLQCERNRIKGITIKGEMINDFGRKFRTRNRKLTLLIDLNLSLFDTHTQFLFVITYCDIWRSIFIGIKHQLFLSFRMIFFFFFLANRYCT